MTLTSTFHSQDCIEGPGRNFLTARVVSLHQDGGRQEVGPQYFLRPLLDAGANERIATDAWLANNYCWVVWKLAAYEHSHPCQLKGKLLTGDVVLDQLKYR